MEQNWESKIRGCHTEYIDGDKLVRKDGAFVEYYQNKGRVFALLGLPNGKLTAAPWHHSDTLWYFARHIDGMHPLND